MDKILLKKAAIQSVALMLAVVTISYALRQNQVITISASDIYNDNGVTAPTETDKTFEPDSDISEGLITDTVDQSINKIKINVFPDMDQYIDNSIYNQLGSRYLIIRKSVSKNVKLALEDLYMTKSIRILLSGPKQAYFGNNSVGRVNGTATFYGEPKFTEITSSKEEDGETKTVILKDYGKDVVHGITISNQQTETSGVYTTELLIELDSVYAHTVYEDEANFYISLKKPKEVYDKILVIDAGHGGKDGGALSKNEKIFEKEINVQILLELKKLLDKENIKVYYTRQGDEKVFLRPRVELANAVDCDFFVSIHCNANEIAWPNGSEVLYYDTIVKKVNLEVLAGIFSEELAKTTTLENRGLVQKHNDDIFILENAVVPAVLIEVGYITNQKDVEYLTKVKNRKAIAQGIYNGIMGAYEEFKPSAEQ